MSSRRFHEPFLVLHLVLKGTAVFTLTRRALAWEVPCESEQWWSGRGDVSRVDHGTGRGFNKGGPGIQNRLNRSRRDYFHTRTGHPRDPRDARKHGSTTYGDLGGGRDRPVANSSPGWFGPSREWGCYPPSSLAHVNATAFRRGAFPFPLLSDPAAAIRVQYFQFAYLLLYQRECAPRHSRNTGFVNLFRTITEPSGWIQKPPASQGLSGSVARYARTPPASHLPSDTANHKFGKDFQ